MYARSATDCIAATSTENSDLLDQAASEMVQGNTKIGEATSRIQALGGN